jgi:hypothetical protein
LRRSERQPCRLQIKRGEREMKAMLLAKHSDFVRRALELDPSPPDLTDEAQNIEEGSCRKSLPSSIKTYPFFR